MVRDFVTGRFAVVNKAFEEALGYSRAEILGRRPEDLELFKPLTNDQYYFSRVVGAGRIEAPIALFRKDGAIVDAIFNATLTDVSGTAYLIIVLHGLAPR